MFRQAGLDSATMNSIDVQFVEGEFMGLETSSGRLPR